MEAIVVFKRREQGFEKRVMRQKSYISTSFGSVSFTRAKSQNLVPFLLTPLLPPIPISHQLSR